MTGRVRAIAAYLVSPMVVPLAMFIYLVSVKLPPDAVTLATNISVVLAYTGMLVLGWPLMRSLKARKATAIWHAAAAGFAIGFVMWLVFIAGFAIALGQGLSGTLSSLFNFQALLAAIWPGGALGAVVGIIFWLIARPDRVAAHP